LRIPAGEAWQLALGLAIPLLLIQHAGSIRVGTSLYQMQFGYDRILYEMWVLSPENVMRRQLLLLLVAWIHACIGLRSFLRTRSWYRRLSSVLASVATLVPALALVGSSAPVSTCVTRSPTVQHMPPLSRFWSPRRLPRPARCTELSMGSRCSISGWCSSHSRYAAGDAGTRVVRARSRSPIRAIASSRCRLGFPCSRRAAGPEFRTRRSAAGAAAARPAAFASSTRQRCSRPSDRWSCVLCNASQPRPMFGWPVSCGRRSTSRSCRWVPAGPDLGSGALRFDAGVEGGRELPIAAMFVDMRGSTRLATGRLPYLTAGDRLQFDTDGSADHEKKHRCLRLDTP
jgi:adenylate cyclase